MLETDKSNFLIFQMFSYVFLEKIKTNLTFLVSNIFPSKNIIKLDFKKIWLNPNIN